MKKLIHAVSIGVLLGVICVGASGCRRQSSADEPLDTSTYRPLPTPLTEFEQKLKDVRDTHLLYVWVFTRLDGKEFTSEDSQLLRSLQPKADWVGLNDRKTFIGTSNFPFTQKDLAVLEKRYKVEDMSEARP
jgi:hypothetical protein